jgi:L-threonylcarbamoyladenylate synthase
MTIAPATEATISRAAKLLKEGGVIIMPTETVYGIAANALDPAAVKRVFRVKGRPPENPLIVHVCSLDQARSLVSEWNDASQALVERFWPGPLTLVLPKADSVPLEVTGGLSTVALRMPSHPVALAIIRGADCPVAAPSANRFMNLSATRPEHIDPELARSVDLIVDGGPCEVGLESTVVDMTGSPPRILRPGGVSRGQIQAALGMSLSTLPPEGVRKSPGMYRRHYAPKAAVKIVRKLSPTSAGLTFEAPCNSLQIKMPRDPLAYGAALYDALFRLDRERPGVICIEEPPNDPAWEAVADRLHRACGKAA